MATDVSTLTLASSTTGNESRWCRSTMNEEVLCNYKVDDRPLATLCSRPMPQSMWALRRLNTSRQFADENRQKSRDAALSSVRRRRKNRHKNGNNNNVNISTCEFRTISLGIHSELAKLRTSVTIHRHVPRTHKPLEKEAALEIARQMTSLYSEEPVFVTAGYNGAHIVERILKDMGWKKMLNRNSDQFTLKWVEVRSAINYELFREGEQMVNRIPNSYVLTNKLGLLLSLQRYEQVLIGLRLSRVVKLKMTDFVPETYRLDDSFEQRAFFEAFTPGDIWICKPTGLNQGRGIFLIRNLEEFRSNYLEQEFPDFGRRPRHPGDRIVQRYVSKPLLLDGKKFDLRVYMMIASTAPFVVLYRKGYARLCIGDYDNSTDVMSSHLTNQFIQRKETSYEECKENTVWTFERLNQYINNNLASSKNIEVDWVFKTLTNRMRNIMLYCFFAVKHRLKSRVGYFDLYGFDFLIDENMKVWLIEVNANPCMATNCQVLRNVVPNVIQEVLCLSIECFEKTRRGVPLLPLQTLVDFQLLYCGKQTPSQLWTTAPHQLWPIGQNEAPPESDDDVINDRAETSIFHDELASRVRLTETDSRTGRPVSMFELCDGRAVSTATMTTGDATKDVERTPGSMSDEARTAMMDVAGYTPNLSINDVQSSAANCKRTYTAPQPPKPGVPLAKIATEVQAARQLSTNAMAIIQSSGGKGDGRSSVSLQAAGATLYPGLGSGSSGKTLLDYYSARASERSTSRLDQPTRQQFSPPRVTLSFFPSRDADAMSPPIVTPSPTPASPEPPTAPDRSPPQSPPPRRLQSAADGLRTATVEPGRRPLNVAAKSEQNVARPTTTMPTTPDSTPAATGDQKASSNANNSHVSPLKVADRKLSEPLWMASSSTETHAPTHREASPRGGGARSPQNSSHSGAATDVFLSSILSHLIPAPQTAERDWGHFTLVKASPQNQANVDSKAAKGQSLT